MPTEGKRFQHFASDATAYELIDEIKGRHQRPYAEIATEITAQLRDFFERSFAASKRPTRFEQVGSDLVRERYLVALSGGIDSTVVTYLAVAAVGKEAVLPVTMPGRPDDDCLELAALVRTELGYGETHEPYTIDIQPIIRAHMALMTDLETPQITLERSHEGQGIEQKMRSGNFGSRVRVAVLCDLQRAIRGRILGTDNRTEYCQGYGTKFGTPISYDIGVLDDLYKIDVYELARALNVPEVILDTPPSTGFFAGQTHAGELGATIEEQDIFAYLLFEKRLDPESLARQYGASEKFARVMEHRFVVSEHKRRLNHNQDRVHVSRVPLLM